MLPLRLAHARSPVAAAWTLHRGGGAGLGPHPWAWPFRSELCPRRGRDVSGPSSQTDSNERGFEYSLRNTAPFLSTVPGQGRGQAGQWVTGPDVLGTVTAAVLLGRVTRTGGPSPRVGISQAIAATMVLFLQVMPVGVLLDAGRCCARRRDVGGWRRDPSPAFTVWDESQLPPQ